MFGLSLTEILVVMVLGLEAFLPLGAATVPLAMLLALVTGIILGLINGLLIAAVGVNPFVTTLSTMFMFRGLGLVITNGGQTISVPGRGGNPAKDIPISAVSKISTLTTAGGITRIDNTRVLTLSANVFRGANANEMP